MKSPAWGRIPAVVACCRAGRPEPKHASQDRLGFFALVSKNRARIAAPVRFWADAGSPVRDVRAFSLCREGSRKHCLLLVFHLVFQRLAQYRFRAAMAFPAAGPDLQFGAQVRHLAHTIRNRIAYFEFRDVVTNTNDHANTCGARADCRRCCNLIKKRWQMRLIRICIMCCGRMECKRQFPRSVEFGCGRTKKCSVHGNQNRYRTARLSVLRRCSGCARVPAGVPL